MRKSRTRLLVLSLEVTDAWEGTGFFDSAPAPAFPWKVRGLELTDRQYAAAIADRLMRRHRYSRDDALEAVTDRYMITEHAQDVHPYIVAEYIAIGYANVRRARGL
jgi:hypothetical protein